jgi:glycosyltransferase involved in cell wall biosynthesis
MLYNSCQLDSLSSLYLGMFAIIWSSKLMTISQKKYLLLHKYKVPKNQVEDLAMLDSKPSFVKECEFHVDRVGMAEFNIPNPTILPTPQMLLVEGWVIVPKAYSSQAVIYAESAGILYKQLSTIQRADVNLKKNTHWGDALGFSTLVPNEFIEVGSNNIRIHVLMRDQKWSSKICVFEKSLGTTAESTAAASELLRLTKQVSDVYLSWSWRLTHPIRSAYDLLASILTKSMWSGQMLDNYLKYHENNRNQINGGQQQLIQIIKSHRRADNLQKTYESRLKAENISHDQAEHSYQPKISVIVPTYNVDPKWLERCVSSVVNQSYSNWELCLYDDASTNKETIRAMEEMQAIDVRIKAVFGKKNKHIAEASNEAIKIATGDFVALLDNDDEFTRGALNSIVKKLNEDPNLDYIFSDEDKLEMDGSRTGPYFKPGINRTLFLANNYQCHLSVIRKSLGDKIGWFRKGFEGSQDYDLFIRVMESTDRIGHIDEVLYHWRKIPGSTATDYGEKGYANESSIKALTEHIARAGLNGHIQNGLWPGSFRIKYDIPNNPKVSIIIPFKDQPGLLISCVQSILNKTHYENYEILLIDNNSEEEETSQALRSLLQNDQIRSYTFQSEFNFAAINNFAVEQAEGDYILMLNNDTEVIAHDWVRAMLEQAQLKNVGGVGAKLIYADCTVQHAGVILGVGGMATHAFHGFWEEDNYYFGNMNVIREYAAVSAACLMVAKQDYLAVGGMDEKLAIAYNDVDFCLKLRKIGRVNVYTPYAKLFHFESKSRGYENTPEKRARLQGEALYLLEKWGEDVTKDPYFNSNLSKKSPDFSLN